MTEFLSLDGRMFVDKPELAIYRFDAMFDTESALPDHSQLFKSLAWQNCQVCSKLSKGIKGIFTLFLVALIRYQTWRQNGKRLK